MILADGDFVDLDWLRGGHSRLVILSHGLEGSSDAVYIRRVSAVLRSAGFDVLAWSYRGCSGEPNELKRSYHSGESGDLREVIEYAVKEYQEAALVGFSLGGNISLKYLGEVEPHEKVKAAVAISAPVDLAASANVLDVRPGNRIYLRRFLRSLIAKIESKKLRFPDDFDIEGVGEIRSFREFDDRYTAPLHGFADAKDYWAKSSSLQFLPNLTLPALLLNAQNDPFLSPESFPVDLAKGSRFLHLETPASGGHVGFVRSWSDLSWMGKRAVEFLNQHR
jgi:predicted alpha/beta-fold hydrolase